MKYAIFSDIHANVFALRAALAEIDKLKVDKIICLGDIVGNGFYPEETTALLRKRKDVLCVKGNHDFFVTTDLTSFPTKDPRLKLFRWHQAALSRASRKFVASLPLSLEFTDGKYRVKAFHYPMNRRGRFKDIVYMPTEDDARKLFSDQEGDVFLFGHEHTGSATEIDGKIYLNFGTLGNFLFPDSARFGILEIDGDKLSYKTINAYYDDSLPRKKTEELRETLGMENI